MSLNEIVNRLIAKFHLKQWTLGFFYADIHEIIRSGKFDQDITWLQPSSEDIVCADPFPLRRHNGSWEILIEDFSRKAAYGKLSVMTINKDFRQTNLKIILDTKSHLSFPFLFSENNKTYVFPESAQSKKLLCYEYSYDDQSLRFVCEILNFAVYDAAIMKHNGKYWLIGMVRENTMYNLIVYYSDKLFGPYIPHPANPVKNGMNGTRAAGNFIKVDNTIYRPTQNCENGYGMSITINKIIALNEIEFKEEPYMDISVDKRMLKNGIHTIHTLNFSENLITVDGIKWTFSMKEGINGILEKIKK